MKLRDLPQGELPRERAASLGMANLTQRELLAILLRTGTRKMDALELSDVLLARFGDLTGIMRASAAELRRVPGIGVVRAIEIKAAIELGRRTTAVHMDLRQQIRSPVDAGEMFVYLLSALEQEEVWVLTLDTRNRVLTREMVYRGSLNSASMRIAELFKTAIRYNAASVILAHNHPSSDPAPSDNDVLVTKEVIKAGKLLEIDVIDHLVIGGNRFVSLKERRLGFE